MWQQGKRHAEATAQSLTMLFRSTRRRMYNLTERGRAPNVGAGRNRTSDRRLKLARYYDPLPLCAPVYGSILVATGAGRSFCSQPPYQCFGVVYCVCISAI